MGEDRRCVTRILVRFNKRDILKHNYGDIDKSIAQVLWQIDFYSASRHPVSVSRRESLCEILIELTTEKQNDYRL